MRSLLAAVATLLSAAVLFCLPASAAARWACDGPEYVCGSGSVTRPSYENTKSRRERRSAKNTRRDTADAASDDERPARRQRVARSTDEDRPARRQRASRYSSDDDSSGGYTLTGQASYYWQPQRLASGGWFNPNAMTAAHKTLPFGTRVRVTNQRNGESVVVTINDRGPYIAGRIIDLSSAAAGAINMKGSGVVPVKVTVLGRG